ncbi:GTPase ObgE [Gardnerella sp. 2492-Sm]|uniref:GTPase ObgE n=1 Tax=unclassified Gardnerella TaxID=2628112 RepID=UPI003CFF87F8
MSDFVDRVTVHVKGGDGGNGSAGVRREKYKPLAGPNGGNGGDGGSVIFVADRNANSLLDYRFMPHRTAEDGTMGLGDTKDGSKGADLVLPVPVGTVIFTAKGAAGSAKRPGEVLADLKQPGDRFVAAAGGAGGLGNAALANKTRRAPGFALLGEPGEERDVILELKSIADVALVGFPSAGKSSLVASISAAKPKIADYPFTTLVPNLGVVSFGNYRYTIADVPGLIPGASEGKGLGLEFLRHIERTEIIAHVIDCATLEPNRDPISDYHALEHELAQYADKLELPLGAIPIPERPRIIVLNKVDVPEAKELADFVRGEFEAMGLDVFEISTASHEGLKELGFALGRLVEKMREKLAAEEAAREEERVVIQPLEQQTSALRRRRDDGRGNSADFTIEREEDKNGDFWFTVTGMKPERWVVQTNFDNDEAVGYLADRLAKLGVEDELRKKGARPGDEIRIGRGNRMVCFDWDPSIAAGAEGLDGASLGARGRDLRLEANDPRNSRRTNAERRRDYHSMMDAKSAVRDAMMAERKSGHWADPSVDDDRHDENSLFGRGEE